MKSVIAPGAVVSSEWWQNLQAVFAGRLDAGEVVLIDVRPVPVPYTVEYRRSGATELVRFHVVVEVSLPREDKAQLGYFLEQALHRENQLTTRAFYDLLKPHVDQVVHEVTRLWATGGPQSTETTRATIEEALAPTLAERYALAVRVSVSELGRAFVLEQTLGAAPTAPPVRRCPSCARDVVGGRSTCAQCNALMPAVVSSAGGGAACSQCRTALKPQARFCHVCRSPVENDTPPAEPVLRTRDGRSVQIDVVLRGNNEAGAAEAAEVLSTVRAQLAKALQNVDFATLCNADGLARVEAQVQSACTRSMDCRGVSDLNVTLVDVRECGSEWLLAARGELDRASQGYTIGREWLAVDAQGVDLRVAALDHALRAKQVERDHQLATDAAALADGALRESLRDQALSLELADIQRGVTAKLGTQNAAATLDATAATITHTRAIQAATHRHELDQLTTAADLARASGEAQISSVKARGGADDAAYARVAQINADKAADEVKLAKMAALADMDARIRADEERHRATAHARELESKRTENSHTVETLTHYKSMTEGQILAAQIGSSANAAVIGQAFVTQSDTSRTREIEARARADVAAAQQQLAAQMTNALTMVSNLATAAVQGQSPRVPGCAQCGHPIEGRFCDNCGALRP